MKQVYIRGMGTFLPNDPVPNDQIENVIGRINGEESWARPIVLDSNKIKGRHYAIEPTTRRMKDYKKAALRRDRNFFV